MSAATTTTEVFNKTVFYEAVRRASSQQEIRDLLIPLEITQPDGLSKNELSRLLQKQKSGTANPEESTQLRQVRVQPKQKLEAQAVKPENGASPTQEPAQEPVEASELTTQTVESENKPGELSDKDQEGESKKEKWLEGPTEWLRWSIEDTGQPKPRKILDEVGELIGPNKLDLKAQAEKVWHREVARTYLHKGEYWYLNDNERWGVYTKEDLLNILEGAHLFFHKPVDSKAAAIWQREKSKAFIRRILTKNQVDFVGELAGNKTGIKDWKGEKYLIRKGPDIIAPSPGDFSTIEGLLSDILGTEQLPYLYGWLKTSYEALRDREMSTGQMLVFSGPPGIGKSFVKEFVIRPVLGGRHTDPTNYLQGKTNFNADTSRAESWEIDDSVGTADSNKRKMLTGAIKKLTASNDHRLEGKFRDAIQPPPTFHRLSVYCNDEAYDLWVLPEMTGSTADKAIILKAHKAEEPRVTLPGVKERHGFREQIENELPAFVYWLTSWQLPEELQNGRYGVKAFQQAEIAAAIHSMSDEARLLDMIDILLPLSESWEGIGGDLELELRDSAKESGMSRELEKIIWNRQALGNGLGKLRKTNPERVELKKKNWKGYNVWVLKPRVIGVDEEKPKSRKAEISYQR